MLNYSSDDYNLGYMMRGLLQQCMMAPFKIQNFKKNLIGWGQIYFYVWESLKSLVHVAVYVATHMQIKWHDPQGQDSNFHWRYFGLDITDCIHV